MSGGQARISAVVITCNDADVLEPCLESITRWTDELVVVDMGSTDGSRDIATRYGAAVHDHPRLPYVEPARNHAIAIAGGDWVLVIDPDERITPPLADELRRISAESAYDLVYVPRIQLAFGRRLLSPGGEDGGQPRFFRRDAVRWPTTIHEHPDTSGLRTLDLSRAMDWKASDVVMLHDTWRSPQQVFEKISRYIPQVAERRLAQGESFTFSAMTHAVYTEFRTRFFVLRAYEDGLPGFLYSALKVIEEFGVHAEMWDRQGRSAVPDADVGAWANRIMTAHRMLGPVRFGVRTARRARRALAPGKRG